MYLLASPCRKERLLRPLFEHSLYGATFLATFPSEDLATLVTINYTYAYAYACACHASAIFYCSVRLISFSTDQVYFERRNRLLALCKNFKAGSFTNKKHKFALHIFLPFVSKLAFQVDTFVGTYRETKFYDGFIKAV